MQYEPNASKTMPLEYVVCTICYWTTVVIDPLVYIFIQRKYRNAVATMFGIAPNDQNIEDNLKEKEGLKRIPPGAKLKVFEVTEEGVRTKTFKTRAVKRASSIFRRLSGPFRRFSGSLRRFNWD